MSASSIPETMDAQEQANILVELHKSHMEHFNKTRDLEFKVNIALWTLIAVGGYFLKESFPEKELTPSQSISLLVVYISSVVGFYLIHKRWMNLVQKSEDIEKNRMIKERSLIAILLENKNEKLDLEMLKFLYKMPEILSEKAIVEGSNETELNKVKKEVKANIIVVNKDWIRLEVWITMLLLFIIGGYLFLSPLLNFLTSFCVCP